MERSQEEVTRGLGLCFEANSTPKDHKFIEELLEIMRRGRKAWQVMELLQDQQAEDWSVQRRDCKIKGLHKGHKAF